jgi:hypothetical protein
MKSWNWRIPGKTIAVLAAMLGLTASAANAESGPFARMAGAWFGGGRVILSDGQVERIRCRARDDVGGGGDLMQQHLRCASPSYNFDVQNRVTAHRGRISGSWDETTQNIGGQVTGIALGDRVRARVEGGQFAADVTLVPMGNALRVTLAPRGSDVREVDVLLRRV